MIKIRYKQLSDTQAKYIIDNYDKMSYDEIAKNLNISKSKAVAQSILENMGYKVIYLWENDLVNNYRECLEYINKLCLLAKKTP